MSYLLDTNVVSEMLAANPDAKVLDWVRKIPEERFFLSVVTIGELKKGIEKLGDRRRKRKLADWLEGDLIVRFKDRILSLDLPTLITWGILTARLKEAGRVLPAIDSLLAATVLEAELTLVTRNNRDFEDTGIELLNPWEA